MGRRMQWTDRVGRRLKLHDLHVLMTVVQAGSMGKAAQRLNTAQPAISRSISALEHAFKVPLLDRGPKGVAPTIYGRALLKCGVAVFDDLREGVKSIEFLADPAVGEVKIGGNEAIIAGLLSAAFSRLHRQHPGITIHVLQLAAVLQQHHELRERRVDLILGRVAKPTESDINLEVLFQERLFVVAGSQNSWSRRRKIKLCELVHEPWVLPPSDTIAGNLIADEFHASDLKPPERGVAIGSIHLCRALVESGPFLSRPPRTQDIASEIIDTTLAGRNHVFEEPRAQPGGTTLHRMRPRGRKAVDEQEIAVGRSTAQCLSWPSLS
jgi:DNA-binding transcriptional LysR family regulator